MYKKQDYNYLQKIYNHNNNELIVVYGDKKCEILDLVNIFCENKSAFIYSAVDIDFSIQENLFIKELNFSNKLPLFRGSNLDETLKAYLSTFADGKHIIVFDEFTNILVEYPTFINYLINLMSKDVYKEQLMIILCSTDVDYVENIMIKSNNRFIYEISGILKVTTFDYNDICEQFSNITDYNCFALYAFTGGNQIFLDKASDIKLFKDYLIDHMLNKDDELYYAYYNIFPDKIRQTSLYNSILYTIAKGYNTLKQLHEALNIDRAKLSVYLKTLMSYNIIYKSECAEVDNMSCTKKGVYKFTDPYTHYWYYFVFGAYTAFRTLSAERFYKKIIEPRISDYLKSYYIVYCQRKIKLMTENNQYNFNIDRMENYNDKMNAIDFIIYTSDNRKLVCSCDYGLYRTGYKKYEQIVESAKKAKIDYEYIIIFSNYDFESKLLNATQKNMKLILIGEKDKWIN